MLYDPNKQKWTVLVVMSRVGNPNWSRDSRYVYFDTLEEDDPGIYRVGLVDRKVERLASLKDFKSVRLFYSTMNLTPDGEPVLLRNTGIEEIYALELGTR